MDLGLKNKHAMVLGGGRGIGRGIAEALAAEGASVAIVSRDQAVLDKASTEIADKTGGRVIGIAADLAQWSSIEAAFRKIEKELGGVNILINNSGGPPPSPVSGVSVDLWRQNFEAMVLAVMRLTDLALPGMKSRKWGRVLTVASSSVVEPIPSIGISNTLRSALVGWSKTLAGEVARDGITVNMLLPGRIATERIDQLNAAVAGKQNKSVDEVAAQAAASIPMGRPGTIEEFGAVAAFLASEKASYVTGTMMRIDGGSLRSV
jgi:3-oxoacyl-[acyl-carrier protein] reductase